MRAKAAVWYFLYAAKHWKTQRLEKIAHCLKRYCVSRADNGEGVAGFLLRVNDRP